MLKIEKTEVLGIEHAIRGMRNPLNSWDKSDSYKEKDFKNDEYFVVGDKDLALMAKLSGAGTDHRKFMRMITVYVDITAPLYWWKEFDTYKVGTVANSCSTMHKIHEKEFVLDDFSYEHLVKPDDTWNNTSLAILKLVINKLNSCRSDFNSTNNKESWYEMIQLLPSSYNQKRTLMLNYEVLSNIHHSRRNHKLDEWHTFCDWIESLQLSELIMKGCE